jgi:glutamine amidotransferase
MIAVVDYGVGNLASVTNTLGRIGMQSVITSDYKQIQKAEALILPGVGAACEGMKNLSNHNLSGILIDQIRRGKPFLGICLGMQLLFEKNEEGNVQCLGVLKGSVVRYQKERKVPQIGWNRVAIQNSKIKMQNYNSKFKSFSY